MKQTIYFLTLIILAGCSRPKSVSGGLEQAAKDIVKSDDTLQSIINANIHKQPIIDTVFLGFTFSMNKKQAIEHFNKLVKEKKLVFNNKDQCYEYPMAFEMVKANASIAPEFQDNKLYKLSIVISPADEMGTEQTVYLQAAVTYMKKYSGYTLFQESDLTDSSEKQFHWIKNNLHIHLHQTIQGSVVNYINMPVEQLINKQKLKVTDSTKAQTSKDI